MRPYDARRKSRPSTCVSLPTFASSCRSPAAEETALVKKVLTDPDQTMAQSAALRHLDHRATALRLGPAFEPVGRAPLARKSRDGHRVGPRCSASSPSRMA